MSKPAEPPKPTAQVAAYVEVLGTDRAVDFLLKFGGAALEFPRNPGPTSKLVQMIGVQKARELSAKMNYNRRRVPTAKPWIAQSLRARGLSGAEISRRLHVTDVTVRKWLNADRADWGKNPAQLTLFDDDT